MTGYESKKAAALDEDGMYLVHHTKGRTFDKFGNKVTNNEDDDTQVYGDALTIAYQSGYYAGKKAAQPAQRTWVGSGDLEDSNAYQTPPAQPAKTSAERTLQHLGYTNNGGEFWKPPLGTPPAAQPAPVQEPVGWLENLQRLASICPELNMVNYSEEDVDDLNCWAIEVATCIDSITTPPAAQLAQERNFCSRCGKRTQDIHTCTPPDA